MDFAEVAGQSQEGKEWRIEALHHEIHGRGQGVRGSVDTAEFIWQMLLLLEEAD